MKMFTISTGNRFRSQPSAKWFGFRNWLFGFTGMRTTRHTNTIKSLQGEEATRQMVAALSQLQAKGTINVTVDGRTVKVSAKPLAKRGSELIDASAEK